MASRVTLELRGFKEARAAFNAVVLALDPRATNQLPSLYRLAQGEVQEGMRSAGEAVRDKARRNAGSMRVPRRIYTGAKPAIFSFADFNAGSDDKRKRAVLVGVRTGLATRAPDPDLYIRWGKGAKRHKDGSTATGGLSMSFGALFQRGTLDRRIRPTHYFTSAVNTTKGAIVRLMTVAYQKATATLNRNNP